MEVMAKSTETQIDGVSIIESSEVFDVRIDGLLEAVGFIDERTRILYLPTIDYMRSRLQAANVERDIKGHVMDTYLKIGREFAQRGYRRCLMLDD